MVDNKELLKLVQDIEFLQLLLNPNYLSYLSSQGYFKDQNFLKYLDYLNYLKNLKFKRFITYPKCYDILDLLNSDVFRKELDNGNYIDYLHQILLYDWQYK